MKDLAVIERQLDRVQSFFPRVDTKMAGIFAVDATILTISAINVDARDLTRWYVDVPGAFMVSGLIASITFLYRCNFPDLNGGQGSLIYFVSIQNRTEGKFREEFEACSDDAYRADVLEQIWRNSQIICYKYRALAQAIRLTLATLVPFAILLVMSAVDHSRIPLVKG
jgi:hypothetical protein